MRNTLWASAYSLPERRLCQRYTHTCSITDTASAANTPPAMSSRNSALSMIALGTVAIMLKAEFHAARDEQQKLRLEHDRDGAQRAADGEGAGIAHEHLGRMRVEPQKPQGRAGEGAAEDRQLLGAGQEIHAEVARPVDAAEYVRKRWGRAGEDGRSASRR